MAVRFGKLFGNGSQFWFNLQRNYDLAHAERSVDISRIPTLAAQPVDQRIGSGQPLHSQNGSQIGFGF